MQYLKHFCAKKLWEICQPCFTKLTCVRGFWPWPRPFLCLASEGLSSKSRFLVLASDFFQVRDLGLDLERCVLDSTSVNTEL